MLPNQLIGNKDIFYFAIQVTISLCVFSLFVSILIDFLIFSRDEKVKKEKKSVVDTSTMTMFFIGYYFILRSGLGILIINDTTVKKVIIIIGVVSIVLGCIINIAGRFNLGSNWANHIKIYEEHTLVERGVYKIVRHPLYASIMLMFFGGCLVYRNIIALLSVLLIFIPFMYYRAKQEEQLLMRTFPEYKSYRERTGMFFPKLF